MICLSYRRYCIAAILSARVVLYSFVKKVVKIIEYLGSACMLGHYEYDSVGSGYCAEYIRRVKSVEVIGKSAGITFKSSEHH